AARRSSCSPGSAPEPQSPSRRTTSEATTAAMVTTTSTSIRVKPRENRCRTTAGAPDGGRAPRCAAISLILPVADLCIDALAAGRAVGPERPHVDLGVHAGIEILVGVAPGIGRQALDIAALLPVG